MKTPRYEIIETASGPLISESRFTVYDILEAKNNGKTLYEISLDTNLTPLQVQTAFDYIEKHHDALQTTLAEIIEKAEERKKYYMAIAAERKKRPVPMTPERVAFYARLDQIRQREVKSTESDVGWETFLSLAHDAQPGRLENPSVQHDFYLYGQNK